MTDEKMTQNPAGDTVMFQERKRLLFFGLPWTFTKYTVTPDLITINQGLLNTTEDDCYMYKVQDVTLKTSLVLYRRRHKSGVVHGAYPQCKGNQVLSVKSV